MSRTLTLLSYLSAVLVALTLLASTAPRAQADHYPNICVLEDGSSIEISGCNAQGAYHRYFGATIGQYWSALPARQHVNWKIDGPYKCALDITGDVYLTDSSGGSLGLLRDQSWFDEGLGFMAAALSPTACCYYVGCPNPASWNHVWNAPGRNQDCTAPCPSPSLGFEQYENFNNGDLLYLTSGSLRLLDGHGGSSAQHVLHLEAIRVNDPAPGDHTHYHLFFAYVAPGRYRDESTQQVVDRFPNDTFLLNLSLVDVGYAIPVIAKAVAHVSSDIAAASPGILDASDLGMLSSALENCASYCTNGGCQPDGTPDYCTWRADLNADGYIDFSDVTVFSWELPEAAAKYCELSKPENQPNDLDRILSWFGMMKTGRSIYQLGHEMPEIALFDEAQMQRAIANPYGYLTVGPTAAQLPSWSKVKVLYR